MAPATCTTAPLTRRTTNGIPSGWDPSGPAYQFLLCALSPIRQFQAIAAGETFIQELRCDAGNHE